MFSYDLVHCFVAVIFDIYSTSNSVSPSMPRSYLQKQPVMFPSVAQCEIRNWKCLCVGKVCIQAKWPISLAPISGFCSIKRLGGFLPPPPWMEY